MFGKRLLAAVLALTLAPVATALAAKPRIEVPIGQSRLASGAPRYWVELSIADGAPMRALLDTGSTGLRVLAAEAPTAGVTPTGANKTYGYTSGAEFSGPVVRGRITLGQARTGDDFPFQLIDTTRCSKAKPDCPVIEVSPKDYRIGGRGALGYVAIIGVNMGQGDPPNPLQALADSWIIELPRPGSTRPGRLILNPDDADRAGFAPARLDPAFADLHGGFHDAVPGCLATGDGARSLCGPVLLDSGAPVVEIALGADARPGTWPSGSTAVLAIAPITGPPLAASFVIGGDPTAHLEIHPGQGQPRNRISAGVLPFYAFSVLYEPHARILGLKPRQPDTAATETPR
jgi:hypothetical protein